MNTSVNFVSHFCFQRIRQHVCSGHGTPLSDHIRHKQSEIKRYGDYRDKKASRLVTGCRAYCTSACIEHKPVTVCDSPIHHTQSQSCQRHNALYLSLLPPHILSDSTEMNIRTAWICIQVICFSASHWSQFPEANKPGNYFISETGWALSLSLKFPWVAAMEGGESVMSNPKKSTVFLRQKCSHGQSRWGTWFNVIWAYSKEEKVYCSGQSGGAKCSEASYEASKPCHRTSWPLIFKLTIPREVRSFIDSVIWLQGRDEARTLTYLG